MGVWYEKAKAAAAFIEEKIRSVTGEKPKPAFALILGTCFGEAVITEETLISIPYGEIPHFTTSTVGGHAGRLLYAKIGAVYGFIMQGRTHYYEGYESSAVALPVRVFSLLGASLLVLTNAAGGINDAYDVGDFAVITDHLSFFADSPLRGPNEEEFGLRFPSMDNIYDRKLAETAFACAEKMGLSIKKGVYAYMKGPQFETPAEIRALRLLGADLVGMSTVYEAITAGHCGMKVLGISCVTNAAAGLSDKPVSHQDISETEKRVTVLFAPFMSRLISEIKELL